MLHAHLVYFLLQPQISHFFEDPRFLLLGNRIRNQDLGYKCVQCYWGVLASRHSQLSQGGNMYIYTSSCTYIHLYMSM